MTFILILFFVSLLSIVIILYRRVILIRNNEMVIIDESPLLPDAKEVHHVIVKNAKAYSLFFIAIFLRTYIRSSVIIKKKTSETYTKVKNKLSGNPGEVATSEKKEVSAFLRNISEYKKKIKKLKKQIVEEETNS